MSELERALTVLGREVEWPETPVFELRLEPVPPRRRSRWRGLVLALAAVAVAIGIAFAVPPARSAILDLLRLGGVTVERVQTLPSAEERALGADLGRPVTRDEATAILGRAVELPRVSGKPQLHEREGVISAVLATPEPVLVSELRPLGGEPLLKKVASIAGTVEGVQIDDRRSGLWIAGERHVVYWLDAPPRLAGNVLLWEDGGITYRIEGKRLTKERALELARELGG